MHKKEKRSQKIIVISGGSFQGKSLVALALASKINIPLIICTDTIRNMLHILDPDNPHYLTSTYLMSQENLNMQMQSVSEIIKEMLNLYSKRGEDLIIEGMHLSREIISYFSTIPDILMFCLDNKLVFDKRIEYKSLTRHRVEYQDPVTGKIDYGEINKEQITFTPYIKHIKRIKEIHDNIVKEFKKKDLYVIKFDSIEKAKEEVIMIAEQFFGLK